MAQAVWPLTQRKFGETTRRDTWWLQPLPGVSCTPPLSSSTRRGRRSRGTITIRALPVAFLLAAAFGEAITRGSGPSRAGGPARCRFPRRC